MIRPPNPLVFLCWTQCTFPFKRRQIRSCDCHMELPNCADECICPQTQNLEAPIQLRGLFPFWVATLIARRCTLRMRQREARLAQDRSLTARRSAGRAKESPGRTRLGPTTGIDPNLSPGKPSPRPKQKETPRSRCAGYKLLPQLEALSNLTACVGGSGARRSDQGLYQR